MTAKQDAFNKMLKAAFIEKFRKSDISQMEMSRRLGVNVKHVQRMLDPSLGSLSFYLMKGLEELGYKATFKLNKIGDANGSSEKAERTQ